jgi:serine phosphatase RsbU (regulator of sigma subunit)
MLSFNILTYLFYSIVLIKIEEKNFMIGSLKYILIVAFFLSINFNGFTQINRNTDLNKLYHYLNSDSDSIKNQALKALSLKYTLEAPDEDSAVFYADQLVHFSNQNMNDKIIEDSYFVRAFVHTRFNNLNLSIVDYQNSIRILNLMEDTASLGKRIQNLASCYYLLEQMDTAMKYYSQALEIALLLNDESTASKIHNNIGSIFSFTKDYSKAIDNYNKSLEIKIKMNDSSKLYSAYLNLADVYTIIHEYDSALTNLNKAKTSLQNFEQKITWRLGYAEVLFKKGDLIEAEVIYKSVLDSMAVREYEEFSARANLGLANIYMEMNKHDLSIHHGSLALVYFESNDNIAEQKEIMTIIGNCHYLLGQFKESKLIMDKVLVLSDSIHSKMMNEQLNKLQLKYNFTQQDAELNLLQMKNELNEIKLSSNSKTTKYLILAMLSLVVIAVLLFSQNRLRSKKNDQLRIKQDLIALQKSQIEKEKNRTLDSIHSALDVQKIILTTPQELKKKFKDVFVLYHPKAIISGDFYWTFDAGYADIVALVDCTGHGVPGALTSMLGYNLIERVVKEYGVIQPNLILNILSREMARLLEEKDEPQKIHFGMEVSICAINKKRNKIHLASTNTPLYILGKKGLNEFKSDPLTLGRMDFKKGESYSHYEADLLPGDMIYLFSDGYIDQMGGPNRRKFYYQPFRDILEEIHNKDCDSQYQNLELAFTDWKGEFEQTDDVSIVGIRV